MSEATINSLPVELLTMCFDRLNVEQQLAVMSTCDLWCRILSEDRYLRQRRFVISKYNICYFVKDCQKLKRFRAFRILDTTSIEQDTEYLGTLRALLSREKVLSNAEDLIMRSDFPLNKLLDNSESWTIPDPRERHDESINVYAPKLRRLKLVDPQVVASPLLQTICGQIEELDIKIRNYTVMFRTISSQTMPYLHSLTLTATDWFCQPRDPFFHHFTDNYMQTFSRLKYLKIYDYCGLFYAIYENIFRAAVNLETLIVIGDDIDADAFNAIGKMKKLKTLCLLVDIFGFPYVRGLSLPNLQKLTAYIDAFAPLASVPKLKWLCIEDNKQWMTNVRDIENTQTSLRLISQQLEVLHLTMVQVDAWLIESMRDFKNLKSLKMERVYVQATEVGKILRELPTVQNFTMIKCNLMTNPKFYQDMGNKFTEDLKDARMEAFSKKLKIQHPNISIGDEDNKLKRYVKRPHSPGVVERCFNALSKWVFVFALVAILGYIMVLDRADTCGQ